MPATAARSRVAASNTAVASATSRFASALSSAPSAFVCGDQGLLLGGRGIRRLEPLHDLELGILEIALAARERAELALESLRLLRVAARGQPLASRARRVRRRPRRRTRCATARCAGRRGARAGVASSCDELLPPRQQLLDACGLGRVAARVIGLSDAGIELGDVDEAALVGGAGVHGSNLPAHRRGNGRGLPLRGSTLRRKEETVSLLRTKSVEQSIADTDEPEFRLKKSLSALDLTVFGIGVVIGAGIFTLTGRAAHEVAGPAIVLSFAVAAVACTLAALCYAEFASTVPVAGSAYTFSYSSLGELFAWIIGWDLILEMFLGASVVAQGWSAYLGTLMSQLGAPIPAAIGYGGTVDLMAILLVVALGVLITFGIKESMRVNMALVALKLFIVLFVIVAGILFIDPSNWSPFVPPATPTDAPSGLSQPLLQFFSGVPPTAFGVGGIFAGAALVFFAYIGFDVVATTAEETKNPQRDLPIGIIASLVICTVLYCAVALVVTGMVPYQELSPSAALAERLRLSRRGLDGDAHLGRCGRRSHHRRAHAHDRRHPHHLRDVARRAAARRPREGPPAAANALGDLDPGHGHRGDRRGLHADRTARGDGQHRHAVGLRPGVDRRDRAASQAPRPASGIQGAAEPLAAWTSALICIYLMLNLTVETWLRFLVWLVVGFVIYFAYSRRHSRVGQPGYLDISMPHVVSHQRDGDTEPDGTAGK